MNKKKTLEEYLNLNYSIMAEFDSGIWFSWNPEFDNDPKLGSFWRMVGIGKTIEESLQSLEEFRKNRIKEMFEGNESIPLPKRFKNKEIK